MLKGICQVMSRDSPLFGHSNSGREGNKVPAASIMETDTMKSWQGVQDKCEDIGR